MNPYTDYGYCPLCGEPRAICTCTDEDWNRWADAVLYGADDETSDDFDSQALRNEWDWDYDDYEDGE